MKLIAQGAEAKIFLSNKFIIKDRISKSYRIKELDDKIRKRRTRAEGKLLEKAGKIVSIPKVIDVFEPKTQIKMEFVDGKKLSEHLDTFPLKEQKQIAQKMGETISKIHDEGIIHGDLTTSNMILKEDKIIKHDSNSKEGLIKGNFGSLYLIDFGLGYISHKHEDKAVDLHVLKQALEAKHFTHWENLWKQVEKSYKKAKDSKVILERLKAVEKRGRYKH
jgi:TP53 regulating kinase and related kinases